MRGVDAARAWCVRNRAPLLLALALLLLNLAVRAIARALDPDGQEALAPGVVTLGLTALLAAGVALVRLRAGRALAREAAGSAFAAALAAAGIVLFGGYVSGGGLQGGVWLTVGRWLITWGVLFVGAGLGLVIGVALGWDQRTRDLRSYAARPPRRR